ncbi:Uncharacterised protein [Metamycoplasma arthritidis]|uniref:Spermidine/putrescine ABC transporter substrate binding protein n=1 Tax=Metamycoplasma arthritidis (strain 158L3-1) TaxID=243272 RepID=B3PN13_META1|nr:spermidine/putrescine ABC transporter substrate-binding protein [Metamycoplasma arthritidis]ACF07415.1 spermidine/putrescine ABC transporter substrate binding protein [Metamycoplasma arthritidis 158L3-1]VEU78937.1 Uncharacterised protein [Metamycoplasma arthritidis]
MKKNKLSPHAVRIILITFLVIVTCGLFFVAFAVKIKNPYQVSIYNYESYLSKKIIGDIKKKYSYHEFSEVNEFTKAINKQKAVAGIGSDHQIAQLILDQKIKKINFNKVYEDYSSEKLLANYPKILRSHLEKYEQWIISKIKKENPTNDKSRPHIVYDQDDSSKIIGFEADMKPGVDHFYEYLIPYFMQDKVIAYNINKKYRDHLKDIDSIVFKDTNWLTIIKTLVEKHNYKHISWTSSFLDNAMIGQFYATESKIKNYLISGKITQLDNKNYKEVFDHFFNFVKEATGRDIRDVRTNKLITSGLELVNDIIEPSNQRADIAVMYNGDAVDSFYAKDNFEVLGDQQQIKYVRPKNNYMLLDAWIVSNAISDKDSDDFLEFGSKHIFKGSNLSMQELEKEYINQVYKNLVEEDGSKSKYYEENLFKNKDNNEIKTLEEISKSFYEENYDVFKDSFDFNPSVANFDAVSYTPTYEGIIDFVKKYYFLKSDKKPNQEVVDLFSIEDNPNINRQIYQPLDLELRNKVTDYYYQKTKS